jgi:branched-chain amino acid transport system substrate-binding protein
LLTAIQDDREQGYTLARRIFSELGLSRVALLRGNETYGRFGNGKAEGCRPPPRTSLVLEQKYMPGDTDFHRQLSVIQDSNVDAIVLWADQIPAGNILKQMREMGMKQRVFGAFRVYGEEMLRIAGPAAEGLEFVYPYDPTATTRCGSISTRASRSVSRRRRTRLRRWATTACVSCWLGLPRRAEPRPHPRCVLWHGALYAA